MPSTSGALGGRQPVNNIQLKSKYFSAALSSSLTAVEINRDKKRGWIRTLAGRDFQNNCTELFDKQTSTWSCVAARAITVWACRLYQQSSLPKMDVCWEGQKQVKSLISVSCQSGCRKSKKSMWSLWWKTFWAFSYRSLWNGASIFGIEMSGWLTCTWNQRAAHMICIYRQWVWVESFRDGAAVEGEGCNGLCSSTDRVKEMAQHCADSTLCWSVWD